MHQENFYRSYEVLSIAISILGRDEPKPVLDCMMAIDAYWRQGISFTNICVFKRTLKVLHDEVRDRTNFETESEAELFEMVEANIKNIRSYADDIMKAKENLKAAMVYTGSLILAGSLLGLCYLQHQKDEREEELMRAQPVPQHLENNVRPKKAEPQKPAATPEPKQESKPALPEEEEKPLRLSQGARYLVANSPRRTVDYSVKSNEPNQVG